MNREYISGLLIVAFWVALGPTAFAAPSIVQATIPAFDVTLNVVKIDNSYRQYPLLIYKDITYFPMTFDDCNFLGVSTDWSNETGLSINKTAVSSYSLEETKNQTKNNNSYQVSIAKFPIKVNGTSIDNNQEPYPLLFFRDITYFPLTWRFAVDQFGWSYDFNLQTGLKITSYVLPPNDYNIHNNIHSGSKVSHQFDDVTVYVYYNTWGGPAANNLTIEKNRIISALGDPQYAYGYTVIDSSWSSQGEISLQGDWLYTTASIPFKSTSSTQCKINIKTNETILLN
jgi:hypothetical protein